jgi:uncharacterized protein with PIN domain
MLGSLSRWLRMLGYEVKYYTDVIDEMVLNIAKHENRVLLTRDLNLFRKAKSKRIVVFFVEGCSEAEQLASISERFNIRLYVDGSLSRCPICDSPLESLEKTCVRDKIPPGTLQNFKKFWGCNSCEKIYWRGRHWNSINKTLEKARFINKIKKKVKL